MSLIDSVRGEQGHGNRLLVLISISFAFIQTGQFLLPALLPSIIGDLGITPFQAGLALSLMNGVYSVGQYPSGRISDTLNRTTPISVGFLSLITALLLLGTGTNYLVFLLATGLYGLGRALFSVPTRALLSDLYTRRRGQMLGILSTGTDAGGILASGISVYILTITTWRGAFAPLAGFLVFCSVVFVVWSRRRVRFGAVPLEFRSTVRRLFGTRQLLGVVIAYALFWFVVLGVLNFLPTYLQANKGFSPSLASGIFALLFTVGIAIKPLAGRLSDRGGRIGVTVGALVVSAVMLGFVIVGAGVYVVVFGVIVYAAGYKSVPPVIEALLLDLAPEGNVGGDLGAIRGISQGIGSLGPMYIGFAAQNFSYSVAFGGLIVCLLVCAAILAVAT